MGSDVGQIFPTASLHRDHSISYALVCEKEISHLRDQNFNQGRGYECFYGVLKMGVNIVCTLLLTGKHDWSIS